MHALTLDVSATAADELGDFLSERCGALCVSLEDADAGTPEEEPVFDEPGLAGGGRWKRARLCAHFDDERAAVGAAATVAALDPGDSGGESICIRSIAPVDERDWVRLTQAQFGPTPIDAGFWIVPSWSPVPTAATRVIRLDPGMAFGTGTHPTTRMCLRWIARHGPSLARPGARVLDYGCGSGVLAIAAGLFGAAEVDAVDIDPAAVTATKDNARTNGVAVRAGGTETASGRYALVVANILATPLKLLAPLLCARLDAGGDLVLAGILSRQADELRDAYALHVALAVSDEDDGWILMTARSGERPPGA